MVTAYHYTNLEAIRSMRTGIVYGKKGLLPRRRFVRLGRAQGLPETAHDGVIEALLEPTPSSWLSHPRFPDVWRYLFHDICRESYVALLSFELLPSDKAFIVDRAHVERELYREFHGRGPSDERSLTKAYGDYFASRVPALDYTGGYELPQLAIWSKIPFRRLNLEWVRFTDDVTDWAWDGKRYAPSARPLKFSAFERYLRQHGADPFYCYCPNERFLSALHAYQQSKGLLPIAPTSTEIRQRETQKRRFEETLLQANL